MSNYREIYEQLDRGSSMPISPQPSDGRSTKSAKLAQASPPKVAQRFDEGKPKLGYFARSFHKALEGIARVKEFGANKYEDGNWAIGGKPDEEYLDSMARHLDYFLKGEVYDQDSGCAHVYHCIWNLCALMELNYPDQPVVDKELFRQRMAYWADQKRLKNE